MSRTDLRHLAICSVDPPGCKDIDDALHVRELSNGNLEVGVHIADVTHFLEAGCAMDVEAAERCALLGWQSSFRVAMSIVQLRVWRQAERPGLT